MASFDDDRQRSRDGRSEKGLTTNKNMNTNTETENIIGPDKVMDVRPIPCSIKHGLIIRTWLKLPVGDHFILLNGHDPVPLYYQFSAQWPGTFTWEHLVREVDEIRVKITKLKPVIPRTETATSCCDGH